MNETQQEASPIEEAQSVLNWINLVVHAWAATLEPFLRRDFGCHYFGLAEYAGVFVVGFFCLVTTHPDDTFPFGVFIWGSLGLTVVHRIAALLSADLAERHSQYNGLPRLCDWLPFSETTTKRFVEPLFVILVGIGLTWLHQSFGIYVCIGGICLAGDAVNMYARRWRTVRRARDAMIEQEILQDDIQDF